MSAKKEQEPVKTELFPPERGIVRLVKSNRVQGVEDMVRYGIGCLSEHQFMNSLLGVTDYAMNLRQLNSDIKNEGYCFNDSTPMCKEPQPIGSKCKGCGEVCTCLD